MTQKTVRRLSIVASCALCVGLMFAALRTGDTPSAALTLNDNITSGTAQGSAALVDHQKRDTSVSALVRGFLLKLAKEESDSERLKRLQKEVLATIPRFRAGGDRLTRNQAHDRNALR